MACTLREDTPCPQALAAGTAISVIQARRVNSHFCIDFQYNDEMAFDFSGKTAVITGGANGIGAATARALAQGGARVAIFDLEREHPDAAGARLGGTGYEVDITDRASIDRAFSQVGPPDIVIANAGIGAELEFSAITEESWQRTIAVNLTGVFHTLQAAAALMKSRGGAMVMTASTNSYDGEALLAAYNASKAVLLGLLHTATNELGPYGIRVNAVCPGLIRTRLTERHFSNPQVLKDYFRHIPLGRGGDPEEVANASAFLASDLASYITGTALFVDGGQMASKFGTWNEERAEFTEGRWRLR
jgi:NAD(P)-dependent dehydrogenase (short-subunit alcohol dehydrogenase family)